MIVEKDGVKYYVPESMPDEFRIDGGLYQFYDDDDEVEEVDEDEQFQEKELYRLCKVMSGYENKKKKMMFVYRVNDAELSGKARAEAREKMERTKAWRGLMYDMDYVRKEIDAIEKYLKRED